MSRRRPRRHRIAWALGTKLAIALTVSVSASFRRHPVEYRTLGALPGLEPGAKVTLAGQLIGDVVAVDRRGDTTALRLRFVRGAERLPASRTVRLRRTGLNAAVVLEVAIAPAWERVPRPRPFTLGGWLSVRPPKPVFAEPPPPPRPPLLEGPTVPPLLRLLPLAPPMPTPMPPART